MNRIHEQTVDKKEPAAGSRTQKPTGEEKRGKKHRTQKQELEKLRRENDEIKDQLLRKLAEFENFRKRTEREYTDVIRRANEGMIVKLLTILSDLERSLDHASPRKKDDPFREGIELIYAKFLRILEEAGLTVMDTDGQEFDPEIHDAVMQVENPDVPSNRIIETFEKGYYLNNKVIRHAKVSVSK